ncbi:hypothetical protein ALQ64_101482 [Pseudomonas cannabina]|uniref:Uncharacterized protein n=1 Tax=Pseudomonas cannabina TaxID=86840 RepID=A0A3M3KSN9_PSECA|nr:hypothetical protein ALQ64_101482 [Pseudomonas cannabina]
MWARFTSSPGIERTTAPPFGACVEVVVRDGDEQLATSTARPVNARSLND